VTTSQSPGISSHEEALRRTLRGVVQLAPEAVELRLAAWRTLAGHVIADRDLPPFNRATMDGFALRHAEAAAAFSRRAGLPVFAEVHAGQAFTRRVPAGFCVAIATGAPVPAGLDTVVEIERLDPTPAHCDDRSAGSLPCVRFTSLPAPGAAIHSRGADARRGRVLVPKGARLTPQRLALAATVGMIRPLVTSRPGVALLTSGDEVVPASGTPHPHQIRNSNALLLASLVEVMGGRVLLTRHLRDDPAMAAAALEAAARRADVVVTIGGISAGARDPYVAALHQLQATLLVRGATIQPGGPITVARLPRPGRHRRGRTAPRASAQTAVAAPLVVGLPGNPVSALVCAHLFLWPLIQRLLGSAEGLDTLWRRTELAAPARPNPKRTAFRPAQLDRSAPGHAVVVPWAGSGDLFSTAQSDGVLELPPGDQELPSGTILRFLPWAWRAS